MDDDLRNIGIRANAMPSWRDLEAVVVLDDAVVDAMRAPEPSGWGCGLASEGRPCCSRTSDASRDPSSCLCAVAKCARNAARPVPLLLTTRAWPGSREIVRMAWTWSAAHAWRIPSHLRLGEGNLRTLQGREQALWSWILLLRDCYVAGVTRFMA